MYKETKKAKKAQHEAQARFDARVKAEEQARNERRLRTTHKKAEATNIPDIVEPTPSSNKQTKTEAETDVHVFICFNFSFMLFTFYPFQIHHRLLQSDTCVYHVASHHCKIHDHHAPYIFLKRQRFPWNA